jgi:hypothetical protein
VCFFFWYFYTQEGQGTEKSDIQGKHLWHLDGMSLIMCIPHGIPIYCIQLLGNISNFVCPVGWPYNI